MQRRAIHTSVYSTSTNVRENQGQLRPGWCCLMLKNLFLPYFTLVEHYLLTTRTDAGQQYLCPGFLSIPILTQCSSTKANASQTCSVKIGLL